MPRRFVENIRGTLIEETSWSLPTSMVVFHEDSSYISGIYVSSQEYAFGESEIPIIISTYVSGICHEKIVEKHWD